MLHARWLVVIVLVSVVAVACGGSSEDETTTSTSTTVALDLSETERLYLEKFRAAGTAPAMTDAEALALGEAVCHTLELLAAADASTSGAATAIATVELDGMSSSEKSQYAAAFVAAPQTLCIEVFEYADGIAYWLGI